MDLLGTLESFGKAVWEAGKDVVDVVGDAAAVVDGIQAVGDFIGRVGDKTGLDKVVEIGEKLAGWAERVGVNKFLRAADSPILDGGQLVIAGMRLTTGVGTPESGEQFGLGSTRFHDVGATLSSARPTDNWSGEGSSAYAGQNAQQKARATALAAADHDVHRVLATEAYQVNFHRDRLDGWSNWLADVGLVTFGLGLIPEVGKAAKEAAELNAVMAALGSSSLELYQLSSEVEANTAALQQLVGSYDAVARSTAARDGGPQPPLPPATTDGPTAGEKSEKQSDGLPDGALPDDRRADRSGVAVASPSKPNPRGGGACSHDAGRGAAAPTAARRDVTAATTPARPQISGGAAPAALGGVPAAPAALPMATTSSIPMGLINQAVQAAVEKALEKAAEDEKDEKDDEDENVDGEDKDGEADETGGDESDEEPIEPAEVSVPVPPDMPIAATLDRERLDPESSIEPTPAPAQ